MDTAFLSKVTTSSTRLSFMLYGVKSPAIPQSNANIRFDNLWCLMKFAMAIDMMPY